MSKLIDSLRRLSRASPSAIGFRPASAPRVAPMLLLAYLPRASGEALDFIGQGGLDGVIVGTEKPAVEAQALARVAKAAGATPWGVFWAGGMAKDGAWLAEAGADFVVAEAATAPGAILQEKRLGRLLAIEASLSDSLVRAIDALEVEAILLHTGFEDAPFLTISHLLHCQRVAGLLRKPLLATISPALGAADLQSLVGVGIKGVVVKLPDKEAGARLQELRRTLDGLAPLKRVGGEVVALPGISPEPSETETDLP